MPRKSKKSRSRSPAAYKSLPKSPLGSFYNCKQYRKQECVTDPNCYFADRTCRAQPGVRQGYLRSSLSPAQQSILSERQSGLTPIQKARLSRSQLSPIYKYRSVTAGRGYDCKQFNGNLNQCMADLNCSYDNNGRCGAMPGVRQGYLRSLSPVKRSYTRTKLTKKQKKEVSKMKRDLKKQRQEQLSMLAPAFSKSPGSTTPLADSLRARVQSNLMKSKSPEMSRSP